MDANYSIESNSQEQTINLGKKIGLQLKGGEVIAISGPLGSGKTHFIKGIAAGAGATDPKTVNSPTFVIVNQYSGRFEIYHIDAYRLNCLAEFEQLGFDDYCSPQSVVMIEWADKVESALSNINCIRIELTHVGKTKRKIRIANVPEYIKVQGRDSMG
jgi:tRNA threonylcarbamoyladenosine biosynthesis protein TsaE